LAEGNGVKLKLSNKAAHQLKKLRHDNVLKRRLFTAFTQIAAHPFQGKLLEGLYEGTYSLRVGDWRILYRVYQEELIVLIIEVADRKEVYR
jgi:mRNA interferase RelE/StbE